MFVLVKRATYKVIDLDGESTGRRGTDEVEFAGAAVCSKRRRETEDHVGCESESDKRALPASQRPAIYWAKYVYAKQTKGS